MIDSLIKSIAKFVRYRIIRLERSSEIYDELIDWTIIEYIVVARIFNLIPVRIKSEDRIYSPTNKNRVESIDTLINKSNMSLNEAEYHLRTYGESNADIISSLKLMALVQHIHAHELNCEVMHYALSVVKNTDKSIDQALVAGAKHWDIM